MTSMGQAEARRRPYISVQNPGQKLFKCIINSLWEAQRALAGSCENFRQAVDDLAISVVTILSQFQHDMSEAGRRGLARACEKFPTLCELAPANRTSVKEVGDLKREGTSAYRQILQLMTRWRPFEVTSKSLALSQRRRSPDDIIRMDDGVIAGRVVGENTNRRPHARPEIQISSNMKLGKVIICTGLGRRAALIALFQLTFIFHAKGSYLRSATQTREVAHPLYAAGESGILEGTVTLACEPGAIDCKDRPYHVGLLIQEEQRNMPPILINASPSFSIVLAPGSYTVSSADTRGSCCLPILEPITVVIRGGGVTHVEVKFQPGLELPSRAR
jgi:hypothetical protein